MEKSSYEKIGEVSGEPGSKERFEDLEKKLQEKERLQGTISRSRSPRIGKILGELTRAHKSITSMMEAEKNIAHQDALELNQEYDRLVVNAMKALTDLKEFEVKELGMKENDDTDDNAEVTE